MSPRVSVLLPLFNAQRHIVSAIQSVLDQTFRDFELLVIEDGSTDGSADVVRAIKDPRIRLITAPERLGLCRSLNLGIDEARGEWIARMDADDLCEPTRFEKQLAYAEAHPEVDLLGTAIRLFGATASRTITNPLTHPGARAELVFGPPLAHPTVFLRRERLRALGLRYDPAYKKAEDYELWTRAMLAGARFANLPEPLLRYRIHPAQASTAQGPEDAQHLAVRGIRARYMDALGAKLDPEETEALELVSHWEFAPFRGTHRKKKLSIRSADRALAKISQAFLARGEKDAAIEFERLWRRRFSMSRIEAPLDFAWARALKERSWIDWAQLSAEEKRLFLLRGLLSSWKSPLKRALQWAIDRRARA